MQTNEAFMKHKSSKPRKSFQAMQGKAKANKPSRETNKRDWS